MSFHQTHSSLPVSLWYGGFLMCPKEKSRSCQHGLRQTQGNKSGNHPTGPVAPCILLFSAYGSCRAPYSRVPYSPPGSSLTQYLLRPIGPLRYMEKNGKEELTVKKGQDIFQQLVKQNGSKTHPVVYESPTPERCSRPLPPQCTTLARSCLNTGVIFSSCPRTGGNRKGQGY